MPIKKLVFCFLILLSVTASAQKSFRMKCVWACRVSNDTSYVFHDKLGTYVDIKIHKEGKFYSTFINGKSLRGNSEYDFSSRDDEIDYWLYNTNCHFSADFSKMEFIIRDRRLKQMFGKWYSDYYYYVQDLSIEPFRTKEEFESNWKE